ncbi:TfoX/Sxy family protein [Marinobacter alexandrii]|jgi:DNA transformation protein|uniref:TfoX/Sxy family protein n=1 Tax=Marinobacter alexandrii TaxID=2570351 RepID=UPI002ABDE078|nr:TfoX/Sxy family protein [Marinobacter alexandrii]
MKATSEFVKNLNDVFTLFGAIEAKRMFGGYGIYHDGLMFALVADDVLYLKADDSTSGAFVELGLQQFEYEKNGKLMRMSYYAAPEEIFDDLEQAREWAAQAYGAALRAWPLLYLVLRGDQREADASSSKV